MDVNDGFLAGVDVSKPVFIVVEAKRTAKLPDSSSVAELVGQLTSQLIRRYTSLRSVLPSSVSVPSSSHFLVVFYWLTLSGTTMHLGALTDGRKWQFYLVSGGQYFITTLTADTHENTATVLGTPSDLTAMLTLGLLTLFCAGQFPTNDPTMPTWIKP
jgi:hypothetical protein